MKCYTYHWIDEGERDGRTRTLMIARVALWHENTSLKCKRLMATVVAVDKAGKREVEGYIGEEFHSLTAAQQWLDSFADRAGYPLNGANAEPPKIVQNGRACSFKE